MAGIQEIYDLVVKGKAKLTAPAVQEALDAGCAPTEILNQGMIRAMDEVGARFKAGDIFVPEMLVAARAMKKGVEVLKPHLAAGTAGAAGKVIIGTVAGDLHDIGKNPPALRLSIWVWMCRCRSFWRRWKPIRILGLCAALHF